MANKLNKLTLPATILIAILVLGGFYCTTQVIQEHKEYIAKRRMDCYKIYKEERNKWSNVEGNSYNEKKDVCEITYKNPKYNDKICKNKEKEYVDKHIKELKERIKKYGRDTTLNSIPIPAECSKTFTRNF